MTQRTEIRRKWVVVIHAGTDKEEVIKDCDTRPEAEGYLHYCCIADDCADVMKRLPDGTLTTEF